MSWFYIYTLLEWTIRLVMVPVILRRRFWPSVGLAWLTLIFFLPEVGLVVYLLTGGDRLAYRRVRRYRRFLHTVRPTGRAAAARGRHATRAVAHPEASRFVQKAGRLGDTPIVVGNNVELLGDSREFIARLVRDIDAAQHHVHMVFYIFKPDDTGWQVGDALIRAAQRGVTCRVLADGVGSWSSFSRNGMAHTLRQAGVRCLPFLPVAPLRRGFARLDLRNHRKLAVLDGRVAFSGSQNIVNPAYNHWRGGQWIDLSARYQGPIVAELQNVFLDDWMFETQENLDSDDLFPPQEAAGDVAAQCVTTGPTDESESLQRVILAGIHAARHRLIITSPYLVPDEPTMVALSMAVEQGADVSLVIPKRSDHPLVSAAARAYIEPLVKAGVKVFQHDKGLLHAKTMTVDDSLALLGSSNLDVRSFYLNFELNVLMYGQQITRQLRFAQTRYLEESTPVSLEAWNRRPTLSRYVDSAAALLSPLL
ncbi:MAG: cardiolipin synthase [Phycisphaeraceae bacterium]|nr:cardiolipin synthase [Phycisphaeraceae bacterium]